MTKNYIIYALVDPRVWWIPKYIGVTCYPQSRKRSHIRAAKQEINLPVYDWIRSLLDLGLEPILHELEVFDACSGRTEYFWIRYCREQFPGHLTNVYSGLRSINDLAANDITKAVRHAAELLFRREMSYCQFNMTLGDWEEVIAETPGPFMLYVYEKCKAQWLKELFLSAWHKCEVFGDEVVIRKTRFYKTTLS